MRKQSNDFWQSDLAEADSWLTNLLTYFQLQSHSVFGEWTTVSFDTAAEWAFPGPLPCTGWLSQPRQSCSAATSGTASPLPEFQVPVFCCKPWQEKKTPTIINYTALLNSRQLFAKTRIIQFPLDPDENLQIPAGLNKTSCAHGFTCICLLEHCLLLYHYVLTL